MRKITKKDDIKRLFYEEHLKQTEIAKRLDVVPSYVTEVIKKDGRYATEKEKRKEASKERHKESKKNYIRKKRQADREEYEKLQRQIDIDNEKLSTKTEISDEQFAKWNRGLYEYDPNSSDLVMKKGINAGYNAPKRVSNVINPEFIKRAV